MPSLKDLSGAINLNADSNSSHSIKVLGMVRAVSTAFGPAIEHNKAVELRINQLWGLDPAIEVGIVSGMLRVDGQELVCWAGERFLAARLIGDNFVFVGGRWGNHSIAARRTVTSAKRLLAHWQGYVDNNMRGAL